MLRTSSLLRFDEPCTAIPNAAIRHSSCTREGTCGKSASFNDWLGRKTIGEARIDYHPFRTEHLPDFLLAETGDTPLFNHITLVF